MRLLALLSLVACSTSTPEAPTPADTAPPEPAGPTVLSPGTTAGPWKAAWPVEGGGVAVGGGAEGRLLDPGGTTAVTPAGPCGDDAVRLPGEGVLWLPPGEAVSHQPAPVVTAAVVERASWRLADLVGPPEGIAPGVTEKDPALHLGLRVRSVRKIRRRGPPWQVVVGERGRDLIVALTDREATTLQAGIVLRRSSDRPQDFTVVPPADLDGDGDEEIVVAGDGAGGGFRAVIQVELVSGGLEVLHFEEGQAPSCGGAP